MLRAKKCGAGGSRLAFSRHLPLFKALVARPWAGQATEADPLTPNPSVRMWARQARILAQQLLVSHPAARLASEGGELGGAAGRKR